MTNHEPWGRSPRPSAPGRSGDRPDAPVTPTVRGMSQSVALVPHMFGYLPDHSLVLLTTRIHPSSGNGVLRGEQGYCARVDLPAPEHVALAGPSLAARMRGGLAGETGLALHVLCYDLPEDDAGEPDPAYAEPLMAMLREAAELMGVLLHDVVQVRGTSHRAVMIAGAAVDHPWSEVPDASEVPAVADHVLRGRSPLASRTELAARVRRRDERASAATDVAIDVLSLAPERLDDEVALRSLAAWVIEGQAPSARERAWLCLLLHDVLVRDAVLARWGPALFVLEDVLGPQAQEEFCALVPPWPEGQGDACLDRLLTLAGQVPHDLAAPLLTIAAVVAWTHGSGTIATEACAAALEADPAYTMARLVDQALEAGLRPPRPGRGDRARGGRGRPAA